MFGIDSHSHTLHPLLEHQQFSTTLVVILSVGVETDAPS